jgi:hypothetical protein
MRGVGRDRSAAFGLVLWSGYSINIKTFTFIGELVLAFWLLIRGRRITLSRPITRQDQTA